MSNFPDTFNVILVDLVFHDTVNRPGVSGHPGAVHSSVST